MNWKPAVFWGVARQESCDPRWGSCDSRTASSKTRVKRKRRFPIIWRRHLTARLGAISACRRHKTNLATSSGAAAPAINHLTSCDCKPPITPFEIVKRAGVWQDGSQSAFSGWLKAILFSWVLLQSSHLLADSIYWPSISRSEGSIGFHRQRANRWNTCWVVLTSGCCWSVLLVLRQISLCRFFYSLIWIWMDNKSAAVASCA